jgi:hypothetical protein
VTADASALLPLIRFGGFAAMIGGGLRIVTALIPYDPDSAFQELLFGIIDVGFLFGITGVYLACADRIGRLGLIGFAATVIAIATIVGPDADRFGIDFYWAGASGFLFALAGLAVLLLRQRLLVPVATTWLISFAFGLLAVSGDALAFAASGITLGAGFVGAGVAVLRGSGHGLFRHGRNG